MIRSELNKQGSDIASDMMPDLTPMLDIIFILLVFFILTANSVQYALEVNLPESSDTQSNQMTEGENILIQMYPDANTWGISNKTYNDFSSFSAALEKNAATHPDRSIVIAGDKDVKMDKVMQLFSFLKSKNITATEIMMEPAE
jgi:biopolymer transport protein ExbD